MSFFAEVLFQRKTGLDSETLTYKISEKFYVSEGFKNKNSKEIKKGQLVKVPLRNKEVFGLVWEIHQEEPKFKTLEILEISDQNPLLSEEQMKLAEWISNYYFCPLHIVIKLFIPQRIFKNQPVRTPKKFENYFENKNNSSKTKEQNNYPEKHKLTDDQKTLLDSIKTSKENKFLIHGITGSGKTEIYTRIAENHLKNDQQVLILVPEISLTPQTIQYFEKSLNQKAAVWNSKLSEGEKHFYWESIRENKAKLVIGSRSAIFAPFQNLGAIIIDEEHENSYKQDNSPRYHVHEIANKILEKTDDKIILIFGSATPNIETKEKFGIKTLELNERIGKAELPEVEIVDLREEFQKKNYSIFSEKLQTEIQKNLDNQEQTILFINRRGSASSIVCRECGYKVVCHNCELPMTYHEKTLHNDSLICHHCGLIAHPPTECPNCQGIYIRYLGVGTQKIESELLKSFPGIKVLRADKDTTSKKNSFKEIYQKFKNHEADVLVGTQMIAKGLHLPKVSLVGVVLADIGLNIPDFRATERNFQLMTQVAGRAGRTKSGGKVIIQSYNPENIALKCTKNHNYQEFFKYEREQRQILDYPPFSKLTKLLIEEKSLQKVQEKTEKIENLLWKIAREKGFARDLEINTYPAYLIKLRGVFRYIILIKEKLNSEDREDYFTRPTIIHKLLTPEILNEKIKIDVDPINVT